MAHFFARRVVSSTLLVSLLSISASDGADPPASRQTTLRLIPVVEKSTEDKDTKLPDDESRVPNVDREPDAVIKADAVNNPCVLLQNNNVLFGEAVQQGDQILIRRDDGSEIRLARRQVSCWAKSIRDLYQYRVDHRRDGDVAVHLRDARWCLRYELLDLAAEEIRRVYTIDADNSEAKYIESRIRHLASAPETKQTAVRPVSYEEASPSDENDPSDAEHEFDANWLRQFASHVQPALINLCGQCHCESTDQQWRLSLPATGARASARMTKENLSATMPYIDVEFPSESALFQMATTAHGGVPAPLGARNPTALDILKRWLESVPVTDHEDPPDHRQNFGSDGRDAPASFVANIAAVSKKPAVNPESNPAASTTASEQPSRLPHVANPFDPDLFNRRFHPTSRDE